MMKNGQFQIYLPFIFIINNFSFPPIHWHIANITLQVHSPNFEILVLFQAFLKNKFHIINIHSHASISPPSLINHIHLQVNLWKLLLEFFHQWLKFWMFYKLIRVHYATPFSQKVSRKSSNCSVSFDTASSISKSEGLVMKVFSISSLAFGMFPK